MDTPIRTVRIDPAIWNAVVKRNQEAMDHGWAKRSVADVIRTGLLHYLGRSNLDQVYGDKENAKLVPHQEDE
jgi:hypothetical protein